MRRASRARAFARDLILRQARREQAQRLVRLHRVDRLANGRLRQDAVDPRRHQPDAVRAALQKRPQILLTPGVVDDQKNATVAERLAELGRGGVDRLQPGPLARQEHDQVGDDRDQPLRLLAELRPEDSVEIGVLNVGVVGERLGERRLAVAAGALQRRGDAGDRVALGVEELLS